MQQKIVKKGENLHFRNRLVTYFENSGKDSLRTQTHLSGFNNPLNEGKEEESIPLESPEWVLLALPDGTS